MLVSNNFAGERWIRVVAIGALLSTLPARGQDRPADKNSSSRLPLIKVGPVTTLPVHGLALQLFASAAPDDPNRLLICTFEEDNEHARHPSAAYVSLDAGNTWMQTLVDANSDWVSETSCAAGTNGRAYFAAGVSETSSGKFEHEKGTTEVYRSWDGGLSWGEPRRYPFMDWTALCIAKNLVDDQERLYLFAHNLTLGFGDAGSGRWVNKKPLMAVSDDGLHFSYPEFPPSTADESKVGAFPLGAVVLPGRKVLALVARSPRAGAGLQYTLYRSDDSSYRMLSTIEMPRDLHPVNTLSAQVARDPREKAGGNIYVAFSAVQDGRPALGLATSGDGGQNWHVKAMIQGEGRVRDLFGYATYGGVAVNKDGIVGLTWLPAAGCPIFAVSVDGGETIQESKQLGNCPKGDQRETSLLVDTGHVWGMATWESAQPSGDHTPKRELGLSFQVRAMSQWSTQVVADSAGRFHAFWEELGRRGIPVFQSAAISVDEGRSENFRLRSQKDVTAVSTLRILREDVDAGVFSIDATIENSGTERQPYPTTLLAQSDRSDCGEVRYINPSGTSEDGRAAFHIPKDPSREYLSPNEKSLPFHMEIRLEGCDLDKESFIERSRRTRGRFSPLSLRFLVYAQGR